MSASTPARFPLCLFVESLDRNRYLECAVTELLERGWQVTLTGLSGPDRLSGVLPGCRVVGLGARRAHDFAAASMRLRRILRDTGTAGVLHAFDDIPTVIAGPAVAGLGWRLLNHRHHIDSPLPTYWRLAARATRAPVMACSRAAARAAIAEGIPAERVRLAVNGVPRPRPVSAVDRAAARAAAHAGDGDVLVTLIARLRREKGHAFLLDALEDLEPAVRDRVAVAFVGDGPARADIESRVRRSSVRVTLLGHLDELSPHFAAADLVAMPSEYESFGLVAAEAMAAGTPVLGTPVEGLREVIADGVTGWLVQRERSCWTKALHTLVSDRSARESVAQAAVTRYEQHFTLERMVTDWEGVYEAVGRGCARESREHEPLTAIGDHAVEAPVDAGLMQERLGADDHESPWWGEHRSRYRFASTFVRRRHVLDVACGTGHGLGVLSAAGAAEVVGIELDEEAARIARDTRSGSLVVRADGTALPVRSETIDVVLSFETVEHILHDTAFVAELRRVVTPDGLVLVSTPNARVTRPEAGKPRNPFHVREYTNDEFRELLTPHFSQVDLLGQVTSPHFGVCPYWQLPDDTGTDLRSRVAVAAWKIGVRLPPGIRDRAFHAVTGHGPYPGEQDFVFDPAEADRGHVQVAVCRP